MKLLEFTTRKEKIDDLQVEEHLQFQSEAIKITKTCFLKIKVWLALLADLGQYCTVHMNKESEVNVSLAEPFIEELLYDLIPF